MAQHVINKFDYNTICAGVLRMIQKPELFRRYKKFTEDTEFFFYNDISKPAKSLRNLISQLLSMDSEGKTGDLSIESFDSFLALMPEGEARDDVRNLYARMRVDDIVKAKAADDGCFRNFLDYLKTLRIAKHATPMFQEYQAGNADKASEHMANALAEINEIKDPAVYNFDPVKNYEDVMLGKDVGYIQEVLYLGCEPLDNAIGGFETQTLNVFISMPNGGKSTMCHHIIKRCFEQRKKVHVTCVEDRPKSFLCKLTACITGIPVSRLRKEYRSLTSSELADIERVKKLMAEYLKVDFVYGQGVDMIHKAKLEYDLECKVKGNPAPVVDIIDYTGHIAGQSYGDKMYEKMRTAYGARKDFVLANNKIGFDFAQVNREGTRRANGDDSLTMADLAGSFDIAQVCDNIISINRNMVDRTEHKATLYVAKARDGEAGGIFRITTKYHIAQYDMNNAEWANASQDHVNDLKRIMSEPEK